jgi:Tol biopolymer transport system component
MRLATVAVVLLFLAAAGSAPGAGSSAETGLIAFQRAVGNVGEYEIWIVGPDGSGLRRLSTSQPTGADMAPVFSPDGSTVVFTRQAPTNSLGASLHAVTSRGGQPRRLTRCSPPRCLGDGEAVFSPDGASVAFVRAEHARFYRADGGYSVDRRYSVYVVDAGGTGLRRLSRTPRWFSDHAPTWSADGRSVLFVRSGGSFSDPAGALVSVDVASREETPFRPLPRWARLPTSIALSRDGRSLLVAFRCSGVVCGATEGRPPRLGIAGADGGRLRVVSRSLDADHASWSPSGRSIVARCDGARLCTLRRDGTGVRRLPWYVQNGPGKDIRFVAVTSGSSWGVAR